jgi:fatty-acyl-CoA synthase
VFRYTYKDAYARIKRLANALYALGVEIGDRVGVLEWNTYRYHEMYFGIPGSGAVLVQMNQRLSPTDLSFVANHAETSFVFVDESLIPIAEAIAPQCNTVKGWVILTDKELKDIKTKLSPVFSYEEILAGAKEDIEWPNLDETSAYVAGYTSGTTGRPKGVFYSHRNVYLHSAAAVMNMELSYRDCFIELVPMFHAMGWGMTQAATMAGSKLLFPGRYEAADLGPIVEAMVKENVTVGTGAPAIFMPMLEYIRKMDVKPNFKGARFGSGGSEPPMALMKGFYDMTGAEIIHIYGATETTPLVGYNRPKPWLNEIYTEEQRWDIKRKQGYPPVGIDVKIVDSEEKELPWDGKSSGELLFRGSWITGSYYNAPEMETRFTADGYWKSGDAATIDEEAYIKITDRIKDLIKSGGEWISSVDMENELVFHPAVIEAAVTGVSHPKWEERPIALVVIRPEEEGNVSKEDLRAYLSKKFAKWQLPDEILFVDAIPKTSVGKINKKVIREQYKDIYMGSA